MIRCRCGTFSTYGLTCTRCRSEKTSYKQSPIPEGFQEVEPDKDENLDELEDSEDLPE